MGPNRRLRRLMASQCVVLTDNVIPHLHEEWMTNITDLVSGIPLELLPLHEVNHEINLVDPRNTLVINYLSAPNTFAKTPRLFEQRFLVVDHTW
jgi:hypothetical protein